MPELFWGELRGIAYIVLAGLSWRTEARPTESKLRLGAPNLAGTGVETSPE